MVKVRDITNGSLFKIGSKLFIARKPKRLLTSSNVDDVYLEDERLVWAFSSGGRLRSKWLYTGFEAQVAHDPFTVLVDYKYFEIITSRGSSPTVGVVVGDTCIDEGSVGNLLCIGEAPVRKLGVIRKGSKIRIIAVESDKIPPGEATWTTKYKLEEYRPLDYEPRICFPKVGFQ